MDAFFLDPTKCHFPFFSFFLHLSSILCLPSPNISSVFFLGPQYEGRKRKGVKHVWEERGEKRATTKMLGERIRNLNGSDATYIQHSTYEEEGGKEGRVRTGWTWMCATYVRKEKVVKRPRARGIMKPSCRGQNHFPFLPFLLAA